MKTMMKAWRIHGFGHEDVLRFEDASVPIPAPDEVLIKVHAAGINPVDWKIREGYLKDAIPHRMPLTLGWDVSGEIEETGVEAADFRVGDEVYSRPDIARDGAYAEYIAVRAREVALKPKTVTHVEAASIPLAGITAWQCLLGVANIAPRQRVLIHAASGGVGSLGVQIAKDRKAYVIGTCSQANLEAVRELGADEVIDYRSEAFEERARDMDVVFDTIGGETQEKSWQVLHKGGLLVSIVEPPSEEKARSLGVRASFVFIEPNAGYLRAIADLIDAGKLRAFVGRVFPFSAAREAQRLSQSGHAKGKIVLSVIQD